MPVELSIPKQALLSVNFQYIAVILVDVIYVGVVAYIVIDKQRIHSR